MSVRNLWVFACVVTVAILAVLQPVSAQTPSPPVNAAGFLVDSGEGEPIYAVVSFSEESVSAIELIESSGLPVVSVSFGGLGKAVCSIAATGCDVSECQQRVCQTGDPDSPFWQFWRLSDDGIWSMAQLGASQSDVVDGSIDAWIWTGSEPSLPPLDWPELQAQTGAPEVAGSASMKSGPRSYLSNVSDDADNRSWRDQTATGAVLVVIIGVGAWILVRQRALHQARR